MRYRLQLFATGILAFGLLSCEHKPPNSPSNQPLQVLPDIAQRAKQLPKTVIDYDRTLLNEKDQALVAKLIEVSHIIDDVYLSQVSEENPALLNKLTSLAVNPQYKPALDYFMVMKGRWDRLALQEPFIAPFGDAGKKPEGAGFYPADMTKAEFEKWIADHPSDKEAFESLYTVIRRKDNGLVAIPYSTQYHERLLPASLKLKEAAMMTGNRSLYEYLNHLGTSILKDDYYASDLAWMDLNSPIEVVIGPEEVYEDRLFNYKASFEAFVTVADKAESEKLMVYASHLPDMEKNLPEPEEYKNPNRGTSSPIRVVQEIFTGGDARRGVQNAAFNLPNDEKVREAKGSKKVLLKNVIEAKYNTAAVPIAKRVMAPEIVSQLSFNSFFDQILFHELSHGLGPGIINGPDGKKQDARIYLKEIYSTIEECKADVLGIWNILYAIDHHLITTYDDKTLYTTYMGTLFRGMRFGIDEAHGRGCAIQWNWLREKGAIAEAPGGHFTIVYEKSLEGYKSLATELLTIEATGDYNRANALANKYGVETPEMVAVTKSLSDIPVDINPVFAGAGEK